MGNDREFSICAGHLFAELALYEVRKAIFNKQIAWQSEAESV
jgi:hypothetical protein